jgi:putative ABC transport system permease protein
LGDGLERYGRGWIAQLTDVQAVALEPQLFQMIDGRPVPRADVVVFTPRDAADLAARLDTQATVALVSIGTALITADTGPRHAALVTATLPAAASLPMAALAAGRFFTAAESDAGARVAVVSAGVVATFATTGKPATLLGRTLRLQGIPYQVIGVLAGEAVARDLRVVVPFTAAPPQPFGGAPARLIAFANRVEALDSVKAGAAAWLTAHVGDWRGRVRLQTQEDRLAQVQQGILIFKLAMGALTGISLLVGGIGIMNVLLASVIERTREIGIRRAAGARAHDILLQFLSEAVAITGLGSAVGAAVGFAGAFGVTAVMRARSHATIYAAFSWSTLLVAAAAAALVGIAFGMYPALRASRLTPIDAIRHE